MFDKALLLQAFANKLPAVDVNAIVGLIPESARKEIIGDELERKHERKLLSIALTGLVLMSMVLTIAKRPELVTVFAPKA